MALKITLKLRETASPHLYLDNLKRLMKEDDEIHPMMEKLLKLIKKGRVPYIILAKVKEIIFVPEENLHFERVIEPTPSGYMRVDWMDSEIEDYDKDPKKFIEDKLNFFKKLGYEFYNQEELPAGEIEGILKATKKFGEKK